jgi:hypothetical protein
LNGINVKQYAAYSPYCLFDRTKSTLNKLNK